MADGTLELQGAIVARLKSVAAVTALVEQRIYDPVPAPAQFPYISIGPTDEVAEDADCINGSEITFQIDVWSRAPGFVEARRIANAVRVALTGHTFTLTTNGLVLFEFAGIRVFRDPDGTTSHAVLQFTAFVEASLTT